MFYHYSKCGILFIAMLNISVLNVIMLNVIMLSVITWNVIMLSVITWNVIMVYVGAPVFKGLVSFLSWHLDSNPKTRNY